MRSLLAITLFVHRQYHLASSQYPLFTFETRLLSSATFSCPFVCCDSPNISTAMITCHYPVNSARSNSSVLHTTTAPFEFDGWPVQTSILDPTSLVMKLSTSLAHQLLALLHLSSPIFLNRSRKFCRSQTRLKDKTELGPMLLSSIPGTVSLHRRKARPLLQASMEH
ncbi:hypothetical protein FRB91_010224 [Serendipita sp. 411]|nr:hypothetical protein FRC18_000333 [Serendipita sp. 400]KAG8849112.1 hypothetical protein FRB91_010224 [Serendipita sp. 411]KAG9054550.1 hypothetical protein FS842_004794 [Serendipita sp. 407]